MQLWLKVSYAGLDVTSSVLQFLLPPLWLTKEENWTPVLGEGAEGCEGV